jgi:hypothetical protein
MVEVVAEEKARFFYNHNEQLKLQIRVSIKAVKPDGQRTAGTGRLPAELAVN